MLGMEVYAGRSSDCAGHAVMEDKLGSADCRPVWGLESWRKSSMEDLGRIGQVDRIRFEANCIAQQLE